MLLHREVNLNWVIFQVDEQGIEVDMGGEEVKFGLRYLTTGEINNLQDVSLTARQSRKRGRRSYQSQFQYSKYAAKKLATAITEWDGIVTKKGTPEPINENTVNLLPAWMGSRLLEEINLMNNLDIEEEAEEEDLAEDESTAEEEPNSMRGE